MSPRAVSAPESSCAISSAVSRRFKYYSLQARRASEWPGRPRLARFQVVHMSRAEGSTGCSQRREPLDCVNSRRSALKGRHEATPVAPAVLEFQRSDTSGSRHWLQPAVPVGTRIAQLQNSRVVLVCGAMLAKPRFHTNRRRQKEGNRHASACRLICGDHGRPIGCSGQRLETNVCDSPSASNRTVTVARFEPSDNSVMTPRPYRGCRTVMPLRNANEAGP